MKKYAEAFWEFKKLFAVCLPIEHRLKDFCEEYCVTYNSTECKYRTCYIREVMVQLHNMVKMLESAKFQKTIGK